ncbi:MAG: aminotransferase class IV [Brachybacterium sp.]|nr:aminotransferase class IV [Brachybacterium sp.]
MSPPAAGTLRVIDSWLSPDGADGVPEAHARRFARSCAALLDTEEDQVRAWLIDAARAVPAAGRWFPRAEAWTVTGEDCAEVLLHLNLRPAPDRPPGARLHTIDAPDPRTEPRHKGPDLDLLAELRTEADQHRAGDAVLVDADGMVLETDHSALVWWRGDVLCVPHPELPHLPSVTVERLVAAADEHGVAVRPERARPVDLAGCEVWALNTLRGIDIVVGWTGSHGDIELATRPGRAETWQRRLDARPLAAGAP